MSTGNLIWNWADTEKNPLHQFITVLINNSLEMSVKNYIIRNSIDLVLMGSIGKTGPLDMFFGGNTIQMVKSKVYCPILWHPPTNRSSPSFTNGLHH